MRVYYGRFIESDWIGFNWIFSLFKLVFQSTFFRIIKHNHKIHHIHISHVSNKNRKKNCEKFFLFYFLSFEKKEDHKSPTVEEDWLSESNTTVIYVTQKPCSHVKNYKKKRNELKKIILSCAGTEFVLEVDERRANYHLSEFVLCNAETHAIPSEQNEIHNETNCYDFYFGQLHRLFSLFRTN